MSAASVMSVRIAALRSLKRFTTTATRAVGIKVSSAECVKIGETESLSQLIDEITQGDVIHNIKNSDVSAYSILKANNVSSLHAICAKLDRPLSSEAASAILEKLATLKEGQDNGDQTGLTLLSIVDKNLLAEVKEALQNKIALKVVLDSLSALLNLGIDKGDIFERLLSLLKERLSSSPSDVLIVHLVKFTIALRKSGYKLTEEMQRLLNDFIELKTSEVSKPSEALFLMGNCYVSPAWFDFLLVRVKELLPLMESGDLVSLTQQLANRKKYGNDILPLIAAALTANPSPLLVSQLATLANSVAALAFTDARLLRKLANDIVLNAELLKKWSHITSFVVPFAKMRFGHQKAWEVLTSWMNDNYEKAKIFDLSRAVTACAICDKGYLVKKAAEYLAENLDIEKTPSASVWLNSVYALAICETLTPRLAETILRPEFLKQFMKEEKLAVKIFNFSRIAQIQAYVQCCLSDSYRGPLMKLNDYLPIDKEVNEMAATIKYGSRGVYDASVFHNVLYKLAPLDSHAVAPFLSSDGYFVDAIVQVDENSRFVRIENFDSRRKPILALIFLSSRQLTITCDASEEAYPLGAVALGLKLLRKRGMVPVTFTELEMQSKKYLAQKIEFVRNKLLEAARC